MQTIRRVVRDAVPRHVRRALREAQAEWHISRVHKASLRKAGRLDGRPLRLNLGCGTHPKPGWVNVDLGQPAADLRLDLREPLPFPDGSASQIYCEHFFEHLRYASTLDSMAGFLDPPDDPSEALSFLRECHRVLMPGGVLELLVPDAEGTVYEYAERRSRPPEPYPWWGPKWCDTPMHIVNYVFRQGREHKYAWDEQTLRQAFERTGFAEIMRRPFDPGIDAPDHELGSLCMRATA